MENEKAGVVSVGYRGDLMSPWHSYRLPTFFGGKPPRKAPQGLSLPSNGSINTFFEKSLFPPWFVITQRGVMSLHLPAGTDSDNVLSKCVAPAAQSR
jgi:hypothetical protein